MLKKIYSNEVELSSQRMDETKAGWLADCLIRIFETAVDCQNAGDADGSIAYSLYDMDRVSQCSLT